MSHAVTSDPPQNQVGPGLSHRLLRPGMVLFCDFDGPIVDVSERYYQTYQLALADTQAAYLALDRSETIQVLSKAQFWQLKRDRVPDPEIAQQSGLAGEQIDAFLGRVHQIVNQPVLLHEDAIQPGVRWALSLLCNHGIQLMLVTLRQREQALQILHHYGLANLFSRVYGATDHQAAYDNHAAHKTALLTEAIAEARCYGWRPGWMLGDTEADILAGQALMLPTMALTCGIRSRLYLEQFQPNLIYHNLLSATHYLLGGSSPVPSTQMRIAVP